MKIILYIITFMISGTCFGFNWSKCDRFFDKAHPVTSIFFVLTSSAQSTTSTGDCSLIGMAGHDKKVFLAQNLENLKIDSAKGTGEYIDSYASLAGCNKKAKKVLPIIFQNNYMEIYGDTEKAPRAIYESMEKIMRSDPVVLSGCYIHG